MTIQGAYGVGIADSFQTQAEKKGIKVLGRDRLDPKAADYTTVLTKIKSLNPEALYYGGVSQAGVKVAKQAYDIIPKTYQGWRRRHDSAECLAAGSRPPKAGTPHRRPTPGRRQQGRAVHRGLQGSVQIQLVPDGLHITAYDAALVLIDSVKRLVAGRQAGDARSGA